MYLSYNHCGLIPRHVIAGLARNLKVECLWYEK